MKRVVLANLIFTLIAQLGAGQAKLRKLPVTINHPAINVSSPYISLDGNTLVYISDNADENALTMFYTTKKDAVNWKEPVMMPRHVNSRLNFLRGFALTADGKALYISSLKSGGLGGFDILVSELKGATWTEPINLGLPVNSRSHEACPSLTADETALYFMRCDKMDQKGAEACKLFVSRKSRLGKWEEPEELPDYINTGNSQTPRILGDNETLIFSSDRFPGNKGGMDLYVTKLEGKRWSQPVPLSFANTTENDQYVSVTSLGRYLLKDQPGDRTSELVEILFPEDLKPKATIKIAGTVVGLENPSSPYVAVFNQQDQSRVFNGRPDPKGNFSLYLKEGNVYDLSVEPEKDNFTFFSKVYDLTGDRVAISDKVTVEIKPIVKGTEIELEGIHFDPHTATINTTSTQELRRLERLVKGNPSRKFLIDVTLSGYQKDSIQSDPDLTELKIDTLHFSVEKQIPDTTKIDSMVFILNEMSKPMASKSDSLVDIDKQLQLADSLSQAAFITVLVDSIGIKKTYHNDRTEAQANAIKNALILAGASADNLSIRHKALVATEERKTLIKLLVME